MNTFARKVAKPSGHSPKMMSKVTKIKIAERQRALKRALNTLENMCDDDKTFKICKTSLEEIMLEPKTYNLPTKRMTYSHSKNSCNISPLINKKIDNDDQLSIKIKSGYDKLGKRMSYEQKRSMLKIRRRHDINDRHVPSPNGLDSFKFNLSKCEEKSFSFDRIGTNESTPNKMQHFIFDSKSLNCQNFTNDSRNFSSNLESNIKDSAALEQTMKHETKIDQVKPVYKSAFHKFGDYQPHKESVCLDINDNFCENNLKFSPNELLVLNAELTAYYLLRPRQSPDSELLGRYDVCYNPLSLSDEFSANMNFFKPIQNID